MQDQRTEMVAAIINAVDRHARRGGTATGVALIVKRTAEQWGVEGLVVPGFSRREMASMLDGQTVKQRREAAHTDRRTEVVRAALDALAPMLVAELERQHP